MVTASETILLEKLRRVLGRDDMVIREDVGPYHVANFAGNSRRAMHVSIRDSLKTFQTDYIGKPSSQLVY